MMNFNESKDDGGGNGISWTISTSSGLCSKQTTTPEPHHSIFLQAGCSSWCPTMSKHKRQFNYNKETDKQK